MAIYSDEEVERFYIALNKRTIVHENGCHIWGGPFIPKTGNPYLSLLGDNKKYKKAYIRYFLYCLKHGDILKGRFKVNTSCTNELCVNIDHLILDLVKEEMTIEQLWESMMKRTKKGDNECVIWNSTISSSGYGSFDYKNKTYYTHRLSFMINKNNGDKIPEYDNDGEKLVIRHKCNTKLCINPDHLQLGTNWENCYIDKIEEGSLKIGQDCNFVKLSEEDAISIKNSSIGIEEEGYMTQSEIAIKYGVSQVCISFIINGKTWRHLPNNNGSVDKPRTSKKRKYIKNEWTTGDLKKARIKIYEKISYIDNNCGLEDKMCHIWNGGIHKSGYGQISFKNKTIGVHILSCEIKYGRNRLPEEVTRHLCHIKTCCNPNHITFGTKSQNRIDSIKKGVNNTKLNEGNIREIRKGDKTDKEWADIFGLNISSIYNIRTRRSWKHII